MSVSQLVGASLGYVSYEDDGKSTEVVRRRPYSVVQFDEIEKPHPDVFSILLQLLDDGRITDSHGRTISKEAVYEMMKQQVVELARKTFRPKFMNRIDEYIVSQPLNSSEISKILELQIVKFHRPPTQKQLPNNKLEITLNVLKGVFAEDGTILIHADQPNNKLVIKKMENNAHDKQN
ncbi:unnamed protein product [Arabidopsis thaliana]|uniref:ATPase AAA-type core domain-containing protein n=1 Tax=Arabidopsis thaliana TaxID=3702 RepID=A0A654FC46_ARATH|nr:unnamed protein product [Arabidopsis thaliana]